MARVSPIKLEIVRRRLTQADVALQAGISESRMSRIINQRTSIREYERRNIARVLGLDTKDLEQ